MLSQVIRRSSNLSTKNATLLNSLRSEDSSRPLNLNDRGLNKVLLLGFLGKDPTLVNKKEQNPYVYFPMVTNEYTKDKTSNKLVQRSTWHNIVVHNKGMFNQVANTFKKGDKIYIEGKLSTRYKDNSSQVTIFASNCLLMSQPPMERNDRYKYEDELEKEEKEDVSEVEEEIVS
eukprot:TRINITY_DN14623_c0_g1_i1.p1 TRINITY_DN14623_c0_g1~~TRINITY_DN14623_c0_g1_i1.p1  ORF type:complete len:174 (-),score=44.20 TRINITY_DN14623_c0_g1_i1:22-543(-)